MIKQLMAISLLSAALATSAMAQNSRSPAGDPTGMTTGVASDADPVGKPVGNEPAMIDPHTTGSIELDARAKVDCTAKTGTSKKTVGTDATKSHPTACK